MPPKIAPQQNKCYCNSVGSTCCNGYINCLKGRATGSESIFSVASKNNKQQLNFNKRYTEKKRVQKTDFVKLNRKAAGAAAIEKNRRGNGHSNATHNTTAAATTPTFSRRNSAATTVTFSTPPSVEDMAPSRRSKVTTPNSMKTPSPTPRIILKTTPPVTMATLGDNFRALSVAGKDNNFRGALQPEYTEQRRTYESVKQLMKLVSANGQNFATTDGGSLASDGSDTYTTDSALDAHHLRALQKFRLKNADDCFSLHRQLDLKLPMQQKLEEPQMAQEQKQIRQLLGTLLGRIESGSRESAKLMQQKTLSRKRDANNDKLAKKQKPQATLTPYAVRQKLLQLRMEADEIGRMKPGRKLYGAMGNSFALRYQET